MARFLKNTDYQTQIRTEIITLVAGGLNDPKLLQAERSAVGQMKQHMTDRIDVETLFSKIDAERDDFIIMTLIDMTLYHLYAGSSPRDIPEHRSTRYEDALKWLRKVQNGAVANLPTLEEYKGEIRIFSKTPEQHKW